MAFEKRHRVVLEMSYLPDDRQKAFEDFNKLCVLRGERKEEAYADLLEAVVANHATELEKNWLDWKGLEAFMLDKGFTINRTTFWVYRDKGYFDGMWKTNGVTTLFDGDAILGYFQGQRGTANV